MTRLLMVLAAMVLLRAAAFSQSQATASVDSNNYLIGDWITLRLEVSRTEGVQAIWPTVLDSLEGFELVEKSNITSQQSGASVKESATFTLTAFDTGSLFIPALEFRLKSEGDSIGVPISTSPIAIFVHDVPVDTSQEIKDIKPPLAVGLTFADVLPYLIAVVVLGFLGWLIWYVLRKRKRGESLIPEAPSRPPHEIALDELRALDAERLWQRGKVKEYHSQLTDIVRVYIEKRFDIMAMEMTTDEILSSPALGSALDVARTSLRGLLVRADLVKFARSQPLPAEHEASLAEAFSFVESTWRREPVPVEQTSEAAVR